MRQSNQPAEQNDNNKNNDGRFLLKAGKSRSQSLELTRRRKSKMTGNFSTEIKCRFQHLPEKGYWLLTLGISPDFCVNAKGIWAYMQAHAIIDDYGTLTIINKFE